MKVLQQIKFNRKYYSSRIDNKELANYVSSLNNDDGARIRADIIARKPWDITCKTTLLILIPPIIAGAFPMLLTIVDIPNMSPEKEDAIGMLFGAFSFIGTHILLYIMITGFAFLLPGIYNYETQDPFFRSYANSSKVLFFNGKTYEVVDYGDSIVINKTTSPGFGALALNALKALFYQFKKCFVYRKLLLRIKKDPSYKKEVLNINIEELLEKKRHKTRNRLLKINLYLTLLIYLLGITCILFISLYIK